MSGCFKNVFLLTAQISLFFGTSNHNMDNDPFLSVIYIKKKGGTETENYALLFFFAALLLPCNHSFPVGF